MIDQSSGSEALRNELAALREDMLNLRSDLGELVGTVVEIGRGTASGARERVQSELHDRLEQLQSNVKRAREQGSEAISNVQETLEDHPFASVLVAFGLGVVIGRFLPRR